MRPTIVLLSPPEDHQRIVSRLQQAGAYSKGTLFDRLDRGACSFSVDASGDVLGEFDEAEVDEVRDRIGDFRAIALEYSRVFCIRDLLGEVLQGVSGLLDTNYGEMLEYEEVLARFRSEPLWDWRSAVAE
ncbi:MULTISPECIES: hypothetical protein [unclassified Streptomyces]|uniref:hypothetical protein n=1 Tax=unclassified Streptomyces TaxID=2593676 RepID=UPI00088A3C29|nr:MULTISPECIES: hypothetical protein [unclassified Streptomyces]PBC80872.1 hypothetical protein BX261_0719 [Streptomyces sp. 2321.6]SDR57019.1 hypothetical protein SAMN05216511_6501 [Streptomyces sp. KS_16]SEB92011.1 hypothetical protein SAMN05428940_0718 [Streptomyces sp. 2133.1]SNC62574.1 hypothetical protein SAMN06272741_0717 [Streptomyces sp. 2114.4]